MAPGGSRTRDLWRGRRSNSRLHHGSWMRSAGNRRCCCCPNGALGFNEVTDIFTTALPARRSPSGVDGMLGNRRSRRSMTPTQVIRKKNNRNPRLDGPRMAASTVRDAIGGIRTRITNGTKEPTPSPPAAPGRERPGIQIACLRRAFAPHVASSKEARSAIGVRRCRLVPSDRPRALGHAHHLREPRDPGLPFRLTAGTSVGFAVQAARVRATKNPPERLAREGPCDADC